MKKLVNEVRTTFGKESDVDLTSVNKLTYMLACLDEALRLYPPVPTGLPRTVPEGGAMVRGEFLPEKVSFPFRSCPLPRAARVCSVLLSEYPS